MLNSTSISNISKSISPNYTTPTVDSNVGDISSILISPFSSILKQQAFKINDVFSKIDSKLDKIVEEIKKNISNKGTVQVLDGEIKIVVSHQYEQLALLQKSKLDDYNNSIEQLLNIPNQVLNVLETIKKLVNALILAYTIIEISMSAIPPLSITIPVVKKYIDTKDSKKLMIAQITSIVALINSINSDITKYTEKYRKLRINIIYDDNINSGIPKSYETVENQYIDSSIEENVTENYLELILKVEKYNKKQLIGRAYDKYSGLIKIETAPSFIANPKNLIEELKNILKT